MTSLDQIHIGSFQAIGFFPYPLKNKKYIGFLVFSGNVENTSGKKRVNRNKLLSFIFDVETSEFCRIFLKIKTCLINHCYLKFNQLEQCSKP